jgi:hypothetical protein
MSTQTFQNHVHRPAPTVVGTAFVVLSLVGFAMRWLGIGGRTSFAAGLLALVGSVLCLLYTSRVYVTTLQDRIIRLEMRLRAQSLLTQEQQRLLAGLRIKQVAALRFASDAELPALVERAARENLPPLEIKRSVVSWIPDMDRT